MHRRHPRATAKKATPPTGRGAVRGHAASTPDRIRDAADLLFCRHGYDAVSISDIAHAARTKKALVFYHFGDKAQLFERVLERYYEAHRAALASAFAAGGSLRARLHRMIDAYLDYIEVNHRYAGLIQQQASAARIHPLIERNFAPLFRWTQQVLLEVTPATGPLAAQQFFVTFSGVVVNYFTYAPLLADLWSEDPMNRSALEERRAHVHWLLDVLLDRLEPPARQPRPARLRRRRSA